MFRTSYFLSQERALPSNLISKAVFNFDCRSLFVVFWYMLFDFSLPLQKSWNLLRKRRNFLFRYESQGNLGSRRQTAEAVNDEDAESPLAKEGPTPDEGVDGLSYRLGHALSWLPDHFVVATTGQRTPDESESPPAAVLDS